MEDKRMIVYKESFFSKLKKIFNNLFSKDETNSVRIQSKGNEIKENVKEVKFNSFFEDLKIDTNRIDKTMELKAFIEKIDGNYEELNKLSIEILKKIDKYYDNLIQQYSEKIKNNRI